MLLLLLPTPFEMRCFVFCQYDDARTTSGERFPGADSLSLLGVFGDNSNDDAKQEAQLMQRDRATLRVIEYFAKSLKINRNDTVE